MSNVETEFQQEVLAEFDEKGEYKGSYYDIVDSFCYHTEQGEDRRWSRYGTMHFLKIGNRHFTLGVDYGITEGQETEYENIEEITIAGTEEFTRTFQKTKYAGKDGKEYCYVVEVKP